MSVGSRFRRIFGSEGGARRSTEDRSFVRALFAEYGRDVKETRTRRDHPALDSAIRQAFFGDWSRLDDVRETAVQQPSYDVPFIWLAKHHFAQGEVDAGIQTLTDAARVCRKKSFLLVLAGEEALTRKDDLRSALRLIAQSVHAMGGARRGEPVDDRPYLILAEMYGVLGIGEAAVWAARHAPSTYLDGRGRERLRRPSERAMKKEDSRQIEAEARSIWQHFKRVGAG